MDILLELWRMVKDVFSIGDLIALVAAVASIVIAKIESSSNKKINADNIQANIDANIIAKARIEWIQSVRKACADLIASYENVMRAQTQQDFEMKLNISREKSRLFILYFGVDEETDTSKSELCDNNTNKGKNNEIVAFVKNIDGNMEHYYTCVASKKQNESELNKCAVCKYEGSKSKCEKANGALFTEKDCQLAEKHYQEELDQAKAKIRTLHNDAIRLSEIMRVYLKIEWNRAKEGH